MRPDPTPGTLRTAAAQVVGAASAALSPRSAPAVQAYLVTLAVTTATLTGVRARTLQC